MLVYADCIIEEPAMANPTLIFLTDRNDLDDQLFVQFQRCHEILRQTPVQDSVEHLRKLLNVASGGVVLTPALPAWSGFALRFTQSMSVDAPLPPFTTIQNSCRRRKAGRNAGEGAAGLSRL